MEKSLEEKLALLNRNDYDSARDRQLIDEWKLRVPLLNLRKEWIQNPITLQLVEQIIEQIERIDRVLNNDEYVTELDRKALIKEKKAHKMYLNFLTIDPSKELEVIEHAVNLEVEENQS